MAEKPETPRGIRGSLLSALLSMGIYWFIGEELFIVDHRVYHLSMILVTFITKGGR